MVRSTSDVWLVSADLVAGIEPELVVVADAVRRLDGVAHLEGGEPIGLVLRRLLFAVKNAWSASASGRSNGVSVRKSQTPFRSGAPHEVRGAASSAAPWA